ncbi:MAG: FkbM family methyltransferase [Xanthobacteraceae bacterium]
MDKAVQKIRSALQACERALFRAIGAEFVRSRYGVKLKADWDDATFNFCYFGSYGPALADFLESIAYDFVFVDIGANVGLYSLLAASNAKCASVVAFEPVARTFALLQQNIAANGLERRILPIQAAVSDASGFAEIKKLPAHSGVASLADVSWRTERERVRTVDVSELDTAVPDRGRLVVKIDVEGHEEVVMAELARSRHFDRITAIFYEVSEDWTDPARVRAILERGGFRHFTRHGDRECQYDVLALR